ncbi:hypothetical protein ATANTOWER_023536, partial [Ataeniobius toweri]|nr:hypothetical protein [Ataeniobius toweri]
MLRTAPSLRPVAPSLGPVAPSQGPVAPSQGPVAPSQGPPLTSQFRFGQSFMMDTLKNIILWSIFCLTSGSAEPAPTVGPD